MDFEKFVIDNITDIRSELKEMDEKISDLCTRTTLTEHKIEDVVTQKVDAKANKFKYITIILASITTISVIKALVWG